MAARTSMLHVRVDDQLKAQAAEKLARFGLTVSDAVRILLTRVARDGALPAGLTADPEAYDAWFRAKVQEALADTRPPVPHRQVMGEAQALIDRKRRARADLLSIVDDISDDNPDAAQRLKDEIEAKVARLPEYRKRHRLGRVAGTREMIVRAN